jgi:hypothetical protein
MDRTIERIPRKSHRRPGRKKNRKKEKRKRGRHLEISSINKTGDKAKPVPAIRDWHWVAGVRLGRWQN